MRETSEWCRLELVVSLRGWITNWAKWAPEAPGLLRLVWIFGHFVEGFHIKIYL